MFKSQRERERERARGSYRERESEREREVCDHMRLAEQAMSLNNQEDWSGAWSHCLVSSKVLCQKGASRLAVCRGT